jgi:transcriptional regulator with XRE-family HTH domain
MTGEDLRAWRIAQGMTQTELADAIGKDNMTVSRWETGKIPIGSATLLALALEALAARRQRSTGAERALGDVVEAIRR